MRPSPKPTVEDITAIAARFTSAEFSAESAEFLRDYKTVSKPAAYENMKRCMDALPIVFASVAAAPGTESVRMVRPRIQKMFQFLDENLESIMHAQVAIAKNRPTPPIVQTIDSFMVTKMMSAEASEKNVYGFLTSVSSKLRECLEFSAPSVSLRERRACYGRGG